MEQTEREELVNALTHSVGVLISSAGAAVLIVFATLYGTAWHIVACSIYGTTLVLMFVASTLYHAARTVHTKHYLNIFDHCAIYLLIAGTYTAFTLTVLRGPLGWTLFGIVWGFALGGIVLKMLFIGQYRILSTIAYLVMGWVVIIAARQLIANVPTGGLLLLLGGGLAYSFGVVFYLWRTLPFNHALWHLFVLAGGVLQYFSVLLYVVPILQPA
jgi:hemolysin III